MPSTPTPPPSFLFKKIDNKDTDPPDRHPVTPLFMVRDGVLYIEHTRKVSSSGKLRGAPTGFIATDDDGGPIRGFRPLDPSIRYSDQLWLDLTPSEGLPDGVYYVFTPAPAKESKRPAEPPKRPSKRTVKKSAPKPATPTSKGVKRGKGPAWWSVVDTK